MSLTAVEDHSPSVNLRMKMLGFSNKTVNNLLKSTESDADLDNAIKQFTRNIVRGKSKDFDASQIVLVCGDERSGKTVLSKKLSKFLPTNVDGQINRVISDSLSGNLSSLFQSNADANITSLFRKRQDTNLNDGRLIVDYEGPMDVLNSVLMKLNNIEQKPTVSVIYALEVGKSYNAIQKLLEISQIPNLSIALTKMDLLEVSVAELSAIFDLGLKIPIYDHYIKQKINIEDFNGELLEDLDLEIKPVTGRTMIWPAEWTHAHQGQIITKGSKYIITGWLNIPL